MVRETAATLMYIGKFMGGPQKNYLLHGYQYTLHIRSPQVILAGREVGGEVNVG